MFIYSTIFNNSVPEKVLTVCSPTGTCKSTNQKVEAHTFKPITITKKFLVCDAAHAISWHKNEVRYLF